MEPMFKSLCGESPDITFNPTENNPPAGHPLQHMYREVKTGRIVVFVLISGKPHCFVASGDSELAAIAWMRGCVRGITFLASKVLVSPDAVITWLTPERFLEEGGTFDVG